MANNVKFLLIFLGAIWGSAFMFIKIATPDLGWFFSEYKVIYCWVNVFTNFTSIKIFKALKK